MSNKEKQYLQYIEHSQLRSSCFKPSHSGVGKGDIVQVHCNYIKDKLQG